MRYITDIIDEQTAKKAANTLDWLETIAYAFAVLILLFIFVIRISVVSGDSMLNTLEDGDNLLLWSLGYEPEYGDIVVVSKLYDDKKPLIKRVIATEHQVVNIDITHGTVSVDGQILTEPYIKEPTGTLYDVEFPIEVPENCVFVMGDNRNNSTDSRVSSVGMIDTRYLLGKVIFRYLPFSRIGAVK